MTGRPIIGTGRGIRELRAIAAKRRHDPNIVSLVRKIKMSFRRFTEERQRKGLPHSRTDVARAFKATRMPFKEFNQVYGYGGVYQRQRTFRNKYRGN